MWYGLYETNLRQQVQMLNKSGGYWKPEKPLLVRIVKRLLMALTRK